LDPPLPGSTAEVNREEQDSLCVCDQVNGIMCIRYFTLPCYQHS